MQFWTPKNIGAAGTGAEVQHYTVRLFNAQLCDIRFQMPNNRNPELARYAEYEELSFSYSKIQWLWVAGGTSAEDDWLASDGSNLAAAKPGRASKAAAKRTPAAAPVASVKRKLRRRAISLRPGRSAAVAQRRRARATGSTAAPARPGAGPSGALIGRRVWAFTSLSTTLERTCVMPSSLQAALCRKCS